MKPAAYLFAAMLAACSAAPTTAQAIPADSTFTYQGVLQADGQPVGGSVEMLFRLFQTPEGTEQVGPDIEMTVVPDAAGRFGAELDFGPVFGGDERYLEITILQPDGGPEPSTVLMPRTRLTAAPLAAYALEARIPSLAEVTDGRADSVEDGFHEIQASGDFTRGILLRSGPLNTVFAVPGIRAVDDFTIETTGGELALTMDSSSLTLGPGGIDLQGLTVDIDSDTSITIDAAVSTRVEGVLTTIKGDAQLNLQGGFIILDGQTVINGHQFIDNLAQVTGTLQVSGNAFKPGGGLWGVLSDARTKKHIQPLAGSLETVRALRPVRFEYNNPGHPLYAPGVQHGFIAQEVRSVRPDWITADDEGNLMLTPRGFEAMVVGAIQELESSHRRQTEALRAENDELRARLERLEAVVRTLAAPE